MAYVAVTVEHQTEKRDLALPMQVVSRAVIEGVMHMMSIPDEQGREYFLWLRSEAGIRQIPPDASLGEAGILHGAVLCLMEDKEADALPKIGAYLRAEAGNTYPITTNITLIGRNDPKNGIFVEIDLSKLATDPKAISRRHAQIEQEGDNFYLVDLASTNGTRLNGQRLPPRERTPVWDGDIIEFGRSVASLKFYNGEKR